jgi:HEAT repeat protein
VRRMGTISGSTRSPSLRTTSPSARPATSRRILASLYAVRCDVSAVVRQAALKVWKDVVQNTPKTLREVLPALMTLIIAALASADEERRLVAGRALGEVVRKLGERVLPEIVPILRTGLAADSGATRQGVCLGLAEVIEAASRRQIEAHVEVLVPAVRDALSDALPEVRDAAARAFNTLQRCIGQEAVDRTVPSLLAAVDTPDAGRSARAMAGLQAIVALRPKEILPFLLPRLTAPPLTAFAARTLAAVAGVVSPILHHHVGSLLPPLVAALAGDEPGAPPGAEEPDAVAARLAGPLGEAAATTLAAVDTAGASWTVAETAKYFADPKPSHRRVAAWLLGRFVGGTKANIAPQVPMLLKELVGRLVEPDEHALKVR